MASRNAILVLLLVMGSGLWIHHGSARTGFFSEDFFYLELMERRDRSEVCAEAASGKLLGWFEFYRPTAVAVIALETRFFGTDPLPYHLVNLALVVLSAALLSLSALRLTNGQLLPVFCVAGVWLTLPALVEPLSFWASGPDAWAAFFAAAALALWSRGSWWSLVPALLAYTSKESAFGLGPALLGLALLYRDPTDPGRWRRLLFLGAAQLLIGVLAFAARSWILGGTATPYGDESEWGARLWSGIGALPRFAQLGFGIGSCVLFVCALFLPPLLPERSRRAELLASVLALGAVLAALSPALSLPPDGVTAVAGGRSFVLPGLIFCLTLPALMRHPLARAAVPVLALISILLGHRVQDQHRRHFEALSEEATTLQRRVAETNEDPLLVAALPPSLQWAFPSSTRPPFAPARTVYPLRIGVSSGIDLAPCRPLHGATALGVIPAGAPLLAFHDPKDEPAAVRIVAGDDGSFHVAGAPFPLRALPSLLLEGVDSSAGALLELEVDGEHRFTHHLKLRAPAGASGVLPLLDLPSWSRARCHQLRIHGARRVIAGPALNRPLTIEFPTPGDTLDLPKLVAPFRIQGIPALTKALRISCYNGQGGVQVLVPEPSFSLVRLHELFPPKPVSFYDFVRAGCLMGDDTLFVLVEALADPKIPHSCIARTALTPYHIRLP